MTVVCGVSLESLIFVHQRFAACMMYSAQRCALGGGISSIGPFADLVEFQFSLNQRIGLSSFDAKISSVELIVRFNLIG